MYCVNEGIGPRLNLDGLHFVTIQPSNSTINIYGFHNGKHLLAWEHCNISRTGRVGPLVFLEVDRRCQGGPGVLWMWCPNHLAAKFRESLDKLAIKLLICMPIRISLQYMQHIYKITTNLLQFMGGYYAFISCEWLFIACMGMGTYSHTHIDSLVIIDFILGIHQPAADFKMFTLC